MSRALWSTSFCLAFLLLLGCDRGPRWYKVTGTVTVDSQPLPLYDILFVPLDKQYGPEPGRGKDGAFEFMAREGQKRVEISAPNLVRNLGKRGENQIGDNNIYAESIPERYNYKSILTAEVTSTGKNYFEFTLTTPKK